MKKLIWCTVFCLIVGLAAGPGNVNCAEAILDGTSHQVALHQDARRIVCLAPNLTEMLWYVGLGERQVGRTDQCDYPAEVVSLKSVGGFVDSSLEAILALKPDLVLAYQGNSLELISQLRQLDIQVFAFQEAASLNDIGKQMDAMVDLVLKPRAHKPKALAGWLSTLKEYEANALRDSSSPQHGKMALRVLYGYPGELTYTCGPGSFLNDIIQTAGAVNAAASAGGRWPQVSPEYVLASQPDVILTATSCFTTESLQQARERALLDLANDPVWSLLPAATARRVVVLESSVLLRPGPRSLNALEQLAAALDEWR